MRSARVPPLVFALWSAWAANAEAQPATLAATTPAAHGQQALALRLEPEGLRARACASGPCTPEGGVLLPVPDDVQKRLSSARSAEIELADGKRVLRIDVPVRLAEPAAGAWVMLVAAPLAGVGTEPVILWSGTTGVPRGESGEERVSVVIDEPAAGGQSRTARRVLVGEQREDVTICGRPTLVGAREINPRTLALSRGASAQNLGPAERAKATKLVAERASGEPSKSAARLLRATSASSAVDKRFGTLTDGDPETTWSENKIGDGAGEFVSLSSAAEVGIQAFEITARASAEALGGAAPKTLFLATPERLFEVTLPEDAGKQPPGTRYRVKLPEELHTACVAVVLGDAYPPRPGGGGGGAERDPLASRRPVVTLAEIEARTAFDGQSLEGLVGALAGGGARAAGAAVLLGRSGAAGITAAIAGYEPLDDAGKQLAAALIDAAPCSEQVPFFAARFAASLAPGRPRAAPGELDPEFLHARDRLRRCGRAAAPALAALIAAGVKGAATSGGAASAPPGPRAFLRAADELSLVAPAEAVPVLLDALGLVNEGARRDLRAALARAAKAPRAWPALAEEVAMPRFRARPELVQIDLLRAIGPSLGRVEGAAQALAALASPSASFRTRFLLQAPAAALALDGAEDATAFLRASLRRDPDSHVRARAAEVAAKVPALAPELVGAVDDSEVRVRQAAIDAIGAAQAAGLPTPTGLPAALSRRLAADDWTFIRAGAARALGALPADSAEDQALAAALEDGSPDVRGPALDALGAHRATAYADKVRAIAETATEDVEVRARAMLASAAMCDARSLAAWTALAARAKMPTDEADRRLGGAAVAALGLVHPSDLAARLAPLLAKDAPVLVREMARVALATKGHCAS